MSSTHHDREDVRDRQTPSGGDSSEILFGNLRQVGVTGSTTTGGSESRQAGEEDQQTSESRIAFDVVKADTTHAEVGHDGDHIAVDRQGSATPGIDDAHRAQHRHELHAREDDSDEEGIFVSGDLEEVGSVVVEYTESDELLAELWPKSDDQSFPVQAPEQFLERDLCGGTGALSLFVDRVTHDRDFELGIVSDHAAFQSLQNLDGFGLLVLTDQPP